MHWMVASVCVLSQFIVCENSIAIVANNNSDDESIIYCKLITYNSNLSLTRNITDNQQMEKCIREILSMNSTQMYTVFDDENNGIQKFFYTNQQPFILNDTVCYSNDTIDEIYNITIVCTNSTERLDNNFSQSTISVEFNDSTEYYDWNNSFISYSNYTSTTMKTLPEKWSRIVRVGLASFSVFLAIIIIFIISFLLIVFFKCIQRLLLIRQMPTPHYTIIKHVICDKEIDDSTQESSRNNSTIYHRRQHLSASKLLHLKDALINH